MRQVWFNRMDYRAILEVGLGLLALGIAVTGGLIGIIWAMLRRTMENDKAFLADKIDAGITATKAQIIKSDEEIDRLRIVRHEDRDNISTLLSAVGVLNNDYKDMVAQLLEDNREFRASLVNRVGK